MFIPRSLKTWKPSRARRGCHWCTAPNATTQVMCGPMRWHFCSDECCVEWSVRRYDTAVCIWLRFSVGERRKVLMLSDDELDQTACGRALTRLRSIGDTEVPL